jgi:hypothetical protein
MRNACNLRNGLFTLLLLATPALCEARREMSHCLDDPLAAPKRQTVVLFDGSIMREAGDDGALPYWRKELARFVNAATSEAAVVMAPHERVSLGVLKPDGTGVDVFFEGCSPLLSPEEVATFKASETKLDWFLGNGWQTRQEDATEAFFKAAASSAVLTARALTPPQPSAEKRFSASALITSLRNYAGANTRYGIPRIVLVTDLSAFDLPSGTTRALLSAGHKDGEASGLHLGYSELHLLSETSPKAEGAFDYLRAFFLATEADLESLATAGGALTNISPPTSVRVFQGSIQMSPDPDSRLPVRMRLAWDQSLRIAGSWLEETQGKVRFAPFNGSLSCSDAAHCDFIGDGLFAQIWTDEPGGNPECPNSDERLAFGGFRTLTFTVKEDTIQGTVYDERCFFDGMQKGLPFELREVPDGTM